MRFWLAIRAFFAVLFRAQLADSMQRLLSKEPLPEPAAAARPKQTTPAAPKPKPTVSRRNDALTLLAALQREARLVDIVQEPLANYSDEQIGAAAREVLRDCGVVLQRLFALEPVIDQAEGSPLEVPPGFDPGRYRLTGNPSGEPPYRGQLVHHGWRATQCELPQWSGSKEAAMVVAPVEVEVGIV